MSQRRRRLEEKGEGLKEWLKKGSQIVQNNLFSSSVNPNKLEANELHVPQLVWNNGLKIARSNFSGPGTNVLGRIKRGDTGITIQDKAANLHDILLNKAQNEQDVEVADKRMISGLWKKTSITSPVEAINNLVGIAGIGAKIGLSKLGLADTKTFTNFGTYDKLSDEDKKLLDDRQAELEKEGFGKGKDNSNIQSILISKKSNMSEAARNKMIECMGGIHKKVDETKNYYRYRQQDPSKFKKYRIKTLSKNLKLVLGFN